MAILFTQIVRPSDNRIIVSAECPLSRYFESTHTKVLDDMSSIPGKFPNETQFCSTQSAEEGIIIYFKQFKSITILSAVEVGLSKTSISLFFERLKDLFEKTYGQDVPSDLSYIRFEDVIKEESKKYSKDRGMEETLETLKETKEVCIQNYTNVLQRGHKIEQLEMLGHKLQNISEKFRKKSRKMHVEAVVMQYVFYASILIILFLVLYFFIR
ncbi:vesicle transport protein SEC22 [Nematocida sp. ERTm5]|nr:vesicle transport protein SEC22 [Nematocida sp. AWRm79]KAI5182823.1 vesicle transport protein SEC22 [Nematocida sp. AWRm78]OAG31504.1 vesicle transport protein SEC22 [Nematocida sp. ERTm5]